MTDDDRVAELLRETLRERADALAEPVLVPRPRARRRWPAPVAVTAAAVAAGLLVTGTAVWRAGREAVPVPAATAARPTAAPTVPPSPTTPAAPPGWVPVASLGAEIDVPASWTVTRLVNDTCEPRAATTHLVSRPIGVVPAIACGYPLRGTLVAFRPGPGTPGRTVLPDGRTRITWVAPDAAVSVVATGPAADADLLQRVVRTARAVDVDSAGCDTVPRRTGSDRPTGGSPLPTEPVVDVTYCTYTNGLGPSGYRLVASGRLDPARWDRLMAAVRAGAATPAIGSCATGGPLEYVTLLRVRTSEGVSPVTLVPQVCADRYDGWSEDQWTLTPGVSAALDGAVELGVATFPGPG